jgi:hypothetical protein
MKGLILMLLEACLLDLVVMILTKTPIMEGLILPLLTKTPIMGGLILMLLEACPLDILEIMGVCLPQVPISGLWGPMSRRSKVV